MKNKFTSFALTVFAAFIGSTVANYSVTTKHQSDAISIVNSNDNLESIRKTIQAELPSTPIRSVSPAILEGLYEIITPNGLMHTDKNGRYLFVGGIYDPRTNTDLIKKRKEELGFVDKKDVKEKRKVAARPHLPVKFSQESILELDKYAITYKSTSGAPVVYEIFDPMCGACRSNHKELNSLPITIKKILITSVGSDEINQQVYCAVDPNKAIDSLLNSNSIITSGQSRADCNIQDLEKIKSWMNDNNLRMATPQTIIASTGELFEGANDRTTWKKRLGL